jgi:hypothetical protein
VFIAAQLRLSYIGLSESQMLQIWNHYASRQGSHEAFTLPVEAFSGSDITDYVPATYRWIYGGPGQVEDLPCGGHNVSLTIETVPPASASVAGARLRIELGLVAGGAAVFTAGIDESITLGLMAGSASTATTIAGISESITLGLEAGAAIGDADLSGITESITLSLVAGVGSVASAPGIDEAITLGLVAGVAEAGSAEPEIGDAYGGGYFAGYISHTADGVATHRLIVAPAATGASGTGYTLTTMKQWKTASTLTTGTDSLFDGVANTAAAIAAGTAAHPAADFCNSLTINGYSDWYLPALLELEIAFYNLKPATSTNINSTGANQYAVPPQSANYTSTVPGQTSVIVFRAGESEAFIGDEHWSSSQSGSTGGAIEFTCGNGCDGNRVTRNKTLAYRIRAFRREAIRPCLA